MPEWVTALLSIGGALLGGYVGVKVGLTRLEERHLALERRLADYMTNTNVRLQIIGDRTHDHANRITENSMTIRDATDRLARLERKVDEA